MSVAGLGAQNRAQLINEWSGNIFGMSIDVAVMGTAQIEIVQQYWQNLSSPFFEEPLCLFIYFFFVRKFLIFEFFSFYVRSNLSRTCT